MVTDSGSELEMDLPLRMSTLLADKLDSNAKLDSYIIFGLPGFLVLACQLHHLGETLHTQSRRDELPCPGPRIVQVSKRESDLCQ
jgi:hypothetical protein